MDPKRFAAIDALFAAALELPAAERAAFLATRCGDDVELRREVEALLAQSGERVEALVDPVRAYGARLGASDELGEGMTLGAWRLLAPLDRLRHRAPRPKIRVGCVPGDGDGPTLREALLRPWDLGGRLECFPDADAQALVVITGDGQRRTGDRAAAALIPALPALWVLAPAAKIPGLERVTGRLVRAILRLEDRARGATASAEPGDAARPQA